MQSVWLSDRRRRPRLLINCGLDLIVVEAVRAEKPADHRLACDIAAVCDDSATLSKEPMGYNELGNVLPTSRHKSGARRTCVDKSPFGLLGQVREKR